MKITIVGAGAHRVLGILRSALAIPGVLDGGQVYLCDLNVDRAEVMGRLLLASPEQGRAGAAIRWGDSLEDALAGADVVGVVLPASRPKSFALGNEASLRHGFIGSDNVSPNGALCAVKIAPVLLKIGRLMEQVCPRALLVNFVNRWPCSRV